MLQEVASGYYRAAVHDCMLISTGKFDTAAYEGTL